MNTLTNDRLRELRDGYQQNAEVFAREEWEAEDAGTGAAAAEQGAVALDTAQALNLLLALRELITPEPETRRPFSRTQDLI